MYYPYLRGKQFELTLLRDNAKLFSTNGFHPIIEPVKNEFKPLLRAIDALNDNNIKYTLIVNPQAGDSPIKTTNILSELVRDDAISHTNMSLGYILHAATNIHEVDSLLASHKTKDFTFIHYGYSNGKEIADTIVKHKNVKLNVFIDGFAGKLYQSHLAKVGCTKVLIKDGFKSQKKNSLYPPSEHFSDLHITYGLEGMDGFGDFLIVGDDYSESGGPAYAVAIHLTYLNKSDNDMFIYHFVSDQTSSPTDPGGKFLEALKKLVDEVNRKNSNIFRSNACQIYLELYSKRHYPGLGLVKKLSMQHHIELIANFIEKEKK
jgi:hypothetical protein